MKIHIYEYIIIFIFYEPHPKAHTLVGAQLIWFT